MRKNPENKPLKIVWDKSKSALSGMGTKTVEAYIRSLDAMLVAQATLVKAGKSSALPHFLATVKELEHLHGFHFEILEDQSEEA